MNDQIAKLYDQALVLEGNGDYIAGELDPVKFAELIVRECADIAREVGTNTEPDDFALDRCYEIESKIKQHFGVDE